MVLFKRKQVEVVPPQQLPDDLDTEIWYIPQTGEWFLNYDEYLDRMDYYSQKKFACEITGNSSFDFFEALKYEQEEMQAVENKFPEPVREPILRYVQFSLIPRLDQLVDDVYLHFKKEFFPGDLVNVKSAGSNRYKGIIREKARFAPITLPDGTVREGYCSYRVGLSNSDGEVTVNENQVSRDRNAFTKWYVKTFLKLTLTRSQRSGAPWVVKDQYAAKYRIPTEYPEELKKFEEEEEEDEKPSRKRRKKVSTQDSKKRVKSEFPNIFENLKETPPALSSEDTESLQRWKDRWNEVLSRCNYYLDLSADDSSDVEPRTKLNQLLGFAGVSRQLVFDPNTTNIIVTMRSYHPKTQYEPPDMFSYVESRHIKVWHYEKVFRFLKSLNVTMRKVRQQEKSTKARTESPATLIPSNTAFMSINQSANGTKDQNQSTLQPSKGSVEDLALPFQIIKDKPVTKQLDGIDHVDELMETWAFINVYREALIIDTFTLDDYITCLKWSNRSRKSSLLEEIFCSLLSCIIDTNYTKPKSNDPHHGLLITLPESLTDLLDDGDSTKEFQDDIKQENANGIVNGTENGDAVDPSIKNEKSDEEDDHESNASSTINHNAYQLLNYRKRPWQEILRDRNFKDGGWQIALVGVLSLVDHLPEYQADIEQVYEILAPEDLGVSPASVETRFYENLGINLRIKVLSIVCSLLIDSTTIRSHIDNCLEEAAKLRRERLEKMREYKLASDEAQALHKECMLILCTADTSLETSSAPQREDKKQKSRARSSDKVPLKPTDKELALAKADPKFLKLLTSRTDAMVKAQSANKEKRQLEKRLNEIDLQRIRCIGFDRSYNRYWWFENNGLPTLKNVHTTSDDEEEDGDDKEDAIEDDEDLEDVAEETYLVGRLWIQGPTDEDRRNLLLFSDEQLERWNNLVEQLEKDKEKEKITNDSFLKTEETNSNVKVEDSTTVADDSPELASKEEKTSVIDEAISKFFEFDFQENGSVQRPSGRTIIDEYGAPCIQEFKFIDRKILQETPDLLLSKENWRYIDTSEDIDKLLKLLNQYGIREGNLHKQLTILEHLIKGSIEARRKALYLDENSEEHVRLRDIIENTVIPEQTAEENEEKEDPEVLELESSDNAENDDLVELEADSDSDSAVLPTRSRRSKAVRNTRGTRGSRKTPVIHTELDFTRKKAHYATRQTTKSQEREEKIKMVQEAKHQLEHLKEDRMITRCLEWVNSSAIEELGHTHLNGPKKKSTNKKRR
ncbi:ATP-dependent Isw2p-Itc1p chromatin remodeling complex subunit [Komagataella phaffii CBS 7435]|uniref:Mitochondrial protein required for assembly of ubiquinol cytochrome-c reductase complex (cytochrome) n=2 Tax=Komagataella phaffii TaxID=460519 RepID=C4QZZ8_KOMPG|nr:Mitochondrial protein required for assembly of ubiquinol cytochrome-c reductase complex (cytochrome [Komagataella phaffii GS115]AOA62195.1 GQ67_00242T0 [Komagataella phaffii]CAH2448677.1 ATP-dependent Isw2p-Itc1p chromatin remodeling complex subunit [Komagataella phaffii CBS 7435]AOA67377.1 GQ68_01146T0 [Komagataella phaffii GS115]CAY68822.1 Mitochondrial protein required for assembly of ubiquinol cytochrome-c reductase complex (cytochrome [Komagataella phaffii GS115]CCA38770.1 ATP-dependen